LVIFCEVVLRK